MHWQILPANIIIKPAQTASTSGWTGAVLTITAANSHLCVIETLWQTATRHSSFTVKSWATTPKNNIKSDYLMCYFTAAVTFTSVVSCSNSRGEPHVYEDISEQWAALMQFCKRSEPKKAQLFLLQSVLNMRPWRTALPLSVSQSVMHACIAWGRRQLSPKKEAGWRPQPGGPPLEPQQQYEWVGRTSSELSSCWRNC